MNSGLNNIMNIKVRKNENDEMHCWNNDLSDRELVEIRNGTIEILAKYSWDSQDDKMLKPRKNGTESIKAQMKETNTNRKINWLRKAVTHVNKKWDTQKSS